MEKKKKKVHHVQKGAKVQAQISWDEGQADAKTFDLDISAVIFGRDGRYLETVYFGQLESRDRGCIHVGDTTDNECITVDTAKLSANTGCIVFVVNSYNGHDFSKIETGELDINVAGKTVIASFLGRHGRSTAFVASRLVSKEHGQWVLEPLEVATYGRCFADVIPDIQSELKDLYPYVKLMPKGAVMALQKGEVVDLGKEHNGVKLRNVVVGLGWDPARSSAEIDLDASALLFDANCNIKEIVFFNNLRSSNGSVKHSGDNLTGEGEGDDERIKLDLAHVPAYCTHIVVVVTSYNGDRLTNVRNAFMRLVDARATREILRFDLAGGSTSDTAMLMCRFYRNTQQAWQMKTIGWTCRGRIAKDLVSLSKREIAGKRSNPGHELRVRMPAITTSAQTTHGGSSVFNSSASRGGSQVSAIERKQCAPI